MVNMIRRLRLKFILINMSIVTIMLVVILGLVFYFTSAGLEAESIHMMESIAAQPFHLGIPSEQGEDVRLPFFTLQLGPQGELLAVGGGYYDLSDGEFLDDLIALAFASPKQLGVIREYNLRYYWADIPARPCLVFADISSEQATLDNLVRTCALIGGLSFLLFLGISILLSKWAVRPVDLAWRQQRQFVADASHELKTPLTVIITNAELLQSGEYGEESRQKFLSGILAMSQQMRGLIQQMLELASADHGEGERLSDPIGLSKLVADAVLPFEPVFFEAGLTLTTEIEEGIQTAGDQEQLRQVVEILLDNARKYAAAGGAAQVLLRRRSRSRCVLTVADQGEPIPQEALGSLFKRFYRADPARSRNGSFGLGLSIAESIVQRHGGKIWAESAGGVNSFHVELPCR